MEVAYRKQLDEYLEKIDSVIENGRYKDNWESLSAYSVPTWYKNAKFRCVSSLGRLQCSGILQRVVSKAYVLQGQPCLLAS